MSASEKESDAKQLNEGPVASRTRAKITASGSQPNAGDMLVTLMQSLQIESDTNEKGASGSVAGSGIETDAASQQDLHQFIAQLIADNERKDKALVDKDKALADKDKAIEQLIAERDLNNDSTKNVLKDLDKFAFTKGQLVRYYRGEAQRSIENQSVTIETAPLERRTIALSIFGIINYMFASSCPVKCPHQCLKLRPPESWQISNCLPLFTGFLHRFKQDPSVTDKHNFLSSLDNWVRANAVCKEDETDFDKRVLTLLAINIAEFRNTDMSNPEFQYVALWKNLFDIAISSRLSFRFFSTVELQMKNFESYAVDHRVDLAYCLFFDAKKNSSDSASMTPTTPQPKIEKKPKDSLIPILVIECAGHPIKSDKIDHKDFRKLACEMLGIFLHQIGLLEKADYETKKKIRVFGAFTSADQIQFCVMFAKFERSSGDSGDDAMNIIFQTIPHWRHELKVPNICVNENCKYCSYDWGWEPSWNYDQADILDAFEDNEVFLKVATEEEFTVSASEVDDSVSSGLDNGNGQLTGMDRLTQFSKVILAFGKEVAGYGCWLTSTLDKFASEGKLGKPLIMPKIYQNILPSSRDSHNSSSPGKPSQKSPSHGHSYQTRSKLNELNEDEMECVKSFVSEHSIMIGPQIGCYSRKSSLFTDLENKGRVVVFKKLHKQSSESKFLSLLKDCPAIVPMLASRSFPTFSVLYLQMLSTRCLPSIESFSDLTIACCGMLLDGLTALTALKSAGIVHRDISPSNFMFSWPDRRWKLLDFADACFAQDARALDPLSMDIVGTDGFIAPEVVKRKASYSFCSDLFSLGETVLSLGVQNAWDRFEYVVDDGLERDQFYGILDAVIYMTMPRYPRIQLSEVRTKVFKSLTGMLQNSESSMFTHYNMEALNLL